MIVLLPGTSLQDWQAANAPNLHRLIATGSLAVMNTRTARLPTDHVRETPESALLTLGAGSRAAASSDAKNFLPTETAGALYERRMGHRPPDRWLVNPDWPSVLRANSGLGYDCHPGNLAEALGHHHVFFQAADGKWASLMGASGDGTLSPRGWQGEQPACIVWEAGPNIGAADKFFGEISEVVRVLHGRLLILSPYAGDKDYARGYRLTPVLEWGDGIPPGLLVSPSTRRPGLVTNTDFMPNVAAYFGVTVFPVRPFGQAWSAVPAENAAAQVNSLEEQAYRQANGMKILPYFALALAGGLLVGTLLVFRGGSQTFGLSIPLTAALAALLAGTAGEAAGWFFALLLVGRFLAARAGSGFPSLAFAALIVVLLTLDMATGSHLMRQSLLGYSAVEGARYYGIGNEAMGLLIGSALLVSARLWASGTASKMTTIALLASVALLLGSPLAGAKAGGLLVSLAAFGAFLWEATGRRWSGRVVGAMLALVVACMTLAAVGDAVLLSHHSHLGDAVQRIQAGGWREASDIVSRKLTVEGRLAWHSAWAFPLWIGLGCIWQLRGQAAAAGGALFTGGIVAVVASLLLNDAGVVAAVFCLVPLWSEMASQVSSERPRETFASSGASASLS